jgi:hypothetical protein
MVGGHVLDFCLENDPKLAEILQPDLLDYAAVAEALAGQDVAFYCLGVPSRQPRADATETSRVSFARYKGMTNTRCCAKASSAFHTAPGTSIPSKSTTVTDSRFMAPSSGVPFGHQTGLDKRLAVLDQPGAGPWNLMSNSSKYWSPQIWEQNQPKLGTGTAPEETSS